MQKLTPLTPEQVAQTPPEQLMLKLKGKDLTMYSTVGKRRLESHDKVVIERADLNKTFILNLNARTYSIQAYQEGKATFTYRITRERTPDRTQFYRCDPSLFEVPTSFKLVP